MVPPSIRQNLAGLRFRERLLAFVWGVACWLAVAIVLLLVCGFIDWFIDRRQDTPFGARVGLFAVQAFVGLAAAFWFLLWPQLRRLSDDTLALWVEDKLRHFDHRLISAVQLNQPGAKLDGMSAELVMIVTNEAENQAAKIGFAQVADHSRLKWSASVLAPILVIALLPFLIWPGTAFALLARQALLPVEIPHTISLYTISPTVWPIGDTIPIRYRVSGAVEEQLVGDLVVTPAGQASDRYELKFIKWDGAEAIFGADVLASTVDIRYAARMLDGRTRLPSDMKLVARPVVIDNHAWVRLPVYCGLRPEPEGPGDDRRYEVQQGRGDVLGIPGSGVRVQIKTQKPIKSAWLQFVGNGLEKVVPKKDEDDAPLPEKDLDKKAMKVGSDGLSAELGFDLKEGLTGYRMIVVDEHGFPNTPEPRRSMRVIAEDPPQVMLLRDTFGFGADFDLEGLPVILGERIRVPYACFHGYGLGKANLLYRVLKKHESGNEPAEEEPWVRLPLPEVNPDRNAGPFDPKTGVFINTDFDQAVPFHAAPSFDPQKTLGRTLGGGRVFLETKGLINTKGMKVQLKSQDQVEYCIEVYAAHREPEVSIPVARSETRVSTVMEEKDFETWRKMVSKEDERVKQLEKKQKGVFERN